MGNFHLTPPYLLPHNFDHLIKYIPLSNMKMDRITTVLHQSLQKLESKHAEIINQNPQRQKFIQMKKKIKVNANKLP